MNVLFDSVFCINSCLFINSLLLLSAGPALGGAGPNWEYFLSAQVPSQLAPGSVLVCT